MEHFIAVMMKVDRCAIYDARSIRLNYEVQSSIQIASLQ